ncbi:NAD-dependent epimerase/dehydratase family protein [Geovibrio thiophilus]|uniref:NAD-dependent epimerase/dehydratase family protein n=1 Tax=Geovibrio thiophilus TaxID=139438 RepID=A0A410JVL1_9BACT|nr:NAD(P)H-binding protein [Geovibrio thiophilus]QAR32061.1 NAD-dependent epimerase/dehydratase family protein [Geovibrio thiophilus]
MKKVFVTGGTGFVGSHVISKLIEKGVHVKALVRNKKTHPDAEAVQGDILRPETFADALRGVNAVINLVGIIREFPDKGITFENMHYSAAKNAADAAKAAGVSRFIHMSANGTRKNAVSGYHKTKYQAEEYIKNSGLDFTIFRPSLIYGKGDSFISMLAGYMKKTPVFSYFGDGSYPMQPVSVYETADAFTEAVFRDTAIGKTYPLCGNRVYTYKELLYEISKAMDKKIILLPVPEAVISLAISLFGGFTFFPVTRDQFIMLKEGNTCAETFAFTELGIQQRNFADEIKKYIP